MEKGDIIEMLTEQFPESVSIQDNKGLAPASYVRNQSQPYNKLIQPSPD